MNIFLTPKPPEETSNEPLFVPRVHERMPTVQQLAIALGVLVVVFGISYIPGLIGAADTETVEVEDTLSNEPLPIDVNYFEDVALTARAAYVWDVREQRALYNKNAGDRLPLASLTKLMTTLVAAEKLDSSAPIPITQDAIMQEGESGFSLGETFPLTDLIDLTLLTSSNDGAYAIAHAAGAALASNTQPLDAFITAMNTKAASIGLTQSYFSNPTGLDVSTSTSGGYGSARDMAFLMEYLIQNEPRLLAVTREQSQYIPNQMGSVITAVNTNDVVSEIPGLIGSKTGFTDLAGGNLVIAFDAGLNRPIIITVLGSTREGRFTDVMNLLERTQRTLTNHYYGN